MSLKCPGQIETYEFSSRYELYDYVHKHAFNAGWKITLSEVKELNTKDDVYKVFPRDANSKEIRRKIEDYGKVAYSDWKADQEKK